MSNVVAFPKPASKVTADAHLTKFVALMEDDPRAAAKIDEWTDHYLRRAAARAQSTVAAAKRTVAACVKNQARRAQLLDSRVIRSRPLCIRPSSSGT